MAFRAFVGVPVPADPALAGLLDGLRATRGDLKVVEPENLHLTLAFLGEVPDEAAGPLGDALAGAARAHAPFRLRLAGVGAFPHARRPKVVWAGSEEPEAAVALARDVRAALAAAGHAPDGKDFRAHVTLARVRSDRDLAEVASFLKAHARDPLPAVDVAEAVLFRSVLGPRGPAYEPVRRARLGG